MIGYRYEINGHGLFQQVFEVHGFENLGFQHCNDYLRTSSGKGPCWFTEEGYKEFHEAICIMVEAHQNVGRAPVLIRKVFKKGRYIPIDRHQFIGRSPKKFELLDYCEEDVSFISGSVGKTPSIT